MLLNCIQFFIYGKDVLLTLPVDMQNILREILELSVAYLHDNYLHIENLIFCAGFVRNVGKLVDFWWIHLLEKQKP